MTGIQGRGTRFAVCGNVRPRSMSKTNKRSTATPYGPPRLVGDRASPTEAPASPRQGELPFPVPGGEPPLVPARMVNEYAYCLRLAYLEWVQGEWADSSDTVEGRHAHRRVDRGGRWTRRSGRLQARQTPAREG